MRGWLVGLLHSFLNAGRGVARSVRQGRNLRIHLVAGAYAAALGALAGLDGLRWALVLLCTGAVIAAELLNTALEHLCDALHPQRHPLIGAAKDAAAGAVLVLSLTAVGVGLVTFAPWVLEGGLCMAARDRPWLLPASILSLLPGALFIYGPDKKIKNQKK